MDLKAFASTQNTTVQLNQQRSQLFLEAYQKACQYFEEGLRIRFSDRQVTEKISHFFLEAMKYNRKDPRPYMGMSLLLSYYQDYAQAKDYLLAVLQLDTNNQQAQDLMRYIEKQSQQPKTSQSRMKFATKPVTSTDYDALYDEVNSSIIQQVHILMSQASQWKPAYDTRALAQFEQQHKQLQDIYQNISVQLTIIDEEIDTAELRQRLTPFETMLKRYTKVIETSKTFVHLYQEILLANQKTEQYVDQVTQHAGAGWLESVIESLLDECNRIADQLDELESKGENIKPLEPYYEKWVKQLEQLQEEVD